MKKLLIIMLSVGLALGASAQRFGGHGVGFYGGGPRVVVGVGGYYPFYSPFYNPYYPFGVYPYGNGYGNRPSKLGMQIQDIKNDYNDRIWSVKHDKSLTGKERRHQVHLLKQERDRDIDNAKLNYYKRD
jgi:hypothetical protein